jgi:hypothetical protein
VTSNASKFADQLRATHEELDFRHYAALARALLQSHDKGVRMAGLGFLAGAIPAEHRSAMMERGVSGDVKDALRSGDREETSAALGVVSLYGITAARPVVFDLSEYSEDDGVKKKAAETLAALSRPPVRSSASRRTRSSHRVRRAASALTQG